MTKLFERAVAEVSRLSESEQDRLANLLLEELESESRWDELFAKSPEILERLADEAQAEYRAGLTVELDPDTL